MNTGEKMSDKINQSIITDKDQERIDKAVRLGATKQVQLVKFIYEKLGPKGIKEFAETVIKPWAREWAYRILERERLNAGQISARDALRLYSEVHDHTAICSDHLDMFFCIDHEDLQECGAKFCPVAFQWMKIWPEGAHILCYLYSYSFDQGFVEAMNPNIRFTKHAESTTDQPGIPHGHPCIMRVETKGKIVEQSKINRFLDPNEVEVSTKISELLEGKKIDYLPLP